MRLLLLLEESVDDLVDVLSPPDPAGKDDEDVSAFS
jgi:hypothetical protein